VLDTPHHVTQRGNGRQDVFFTDRDREVHLAAFFRLRVVLWTPGIGLLLMTNHVHFVVIPEREFSLAKVFGRTHADYARYANLARRSCGHLWQACFYSCALEAEHTRNALAYVERNPVRGDCGRGIPMVHGGCPLPAGRHGRFAGLRGVACAIQRRALARGVAVWLGGRGLVGAHPGSDAARRAVGQPGIHREAEPGGWAGPDAEAPGPSPQAATDQHGLRANGVIGCCPRSDSFQVVGTVLLDVLREFEH